MRIIYPTGGLEAPCLLDPFDPMHILVLVCKKKKKKKMWNDERRRAEIHGYARRTTSDKKKWLDQNGIKVGTKKRESIFFSDAMDIP